MAGIVRVTQSLLDILEVLLRAADDKTGLHGWQIKKMTRRTGPTVYTVIDRLVDAGWVEGHWERENPVPSRPRRRLYRLTSTGVVETRTLLAARRPPSDRARQRAILDKMTRTAAEDGTDDTIDGFIDTRFAKTDERISGDPTWRNWVRELKVRTLYALSFDRS